MSRCPTSTWATSKAPPTRARRATSVALRFVAVGVGVVVVGVVALRCVVFWCVLFVVWGVAVCCVVLCCCSACWSCLVCCFLLLRVVGCCGLGLLGASLLGLSCPSRLLVCAAACVACVVVRVFGFVSAAAVCRGCSGFCPRGVLVVSVVYPSSGLTWPGGPGRARGSREFTAARPALTYTPAAWLGGVVSN